MITLKIKLQIFQLKGCQTELKRLSIANRFLLLFSSLRKSYFVTQVDLELIAIILPQPPKYWGYRYKLPLPPREIA